MARKPLNKQALRTRLLEEKARLEQDLAEIEERAAKVGDQEVASELSGYEDHPADLASETFEREKNFAMGESVHAMLQRVKSALAKLDGGTYGLCDACGQPIAAERLEAIPFATLCLACQRRMEMR